jgi:sugar phosphate permease
MKPIEHAEVPSAAGNRVLGKVAIRIMPFLALLYFVNYLDRVNIGFAGPNGMNKELGLTATAFGFASGIFFLGYLISKCRATWRCTGSARAAGSPGS